MIATVASLPRAARQVWSATFGSGAESYQPTPVTTVYRKPHAHLRRYEGAAAATGNPVLLVPPLAVTPACFDLRPGQSLARYLIEHGRQPYVIDYGSFGAADRELGLEDWTQGILPDAIRAVAAAHGGPVDVIGWSIGGALAMIGGAAHADLPLASITGLATPIDQRHTPLLVPVRLAGRITGGREIAWATKLMGGIPQEFVRVGFRLQALDRELLRPWFLLTHAGDAEALARMAAIDRFTATMPGYPGRSYRQIHRSFIVRNELASGSIRLRSDLTVDLAKLTCRVLLVGSESDALVPAAGVRRGVDILTGATEVRFETVPGSHLGLLAGPAAATTTWPAVLDFING
ncbi:alpha/beta fold hydrolase [Nocardia yamanashiensis]|uniref:alpha/beta fold hydrolase n=1 Tax=Nocardia yamanashiensis TaxID=209247 RepID=UPI001E5AFC50|nr:alpha/beta fold hydrolase [Nocardia yamanashiensis]UGT44177.1 alpha/beta fold hydrolase [Nocardia yamanashiensis]